MIDKALAGLNPLQNQGQSYYFQLYPLSLTIIGQQSTVPAPGTTYRFVIYKGQQKFDETKLPIEANYKNINGVNLMVMPKCPINFYTPTFNKNRKTEFQFHMYQYEEKEEYFIAEYNIDIEPYITEYKNSRTVRFEHKNKFSDDYELQFEIYIEKSRFLLEKVVKDYKHERSLKSPLRQRKQSSPKKQVRRISPSKKNLTNEQPEKQEKQEVSNQSSKIQREEVTQISQSRNKKVEESQKSLKGDSKPVSVRNSRNVPSVIQPQRELQPVTNNQAKEVQISSVEKKQESKIQQKSVKNYSEKAASETSSVNKVPAISTRFKPLAKEDIPNQVKMSESQRLGSTLASTTETGQTAEIAKKQGEGAKQKILMLIFLIVSFFLMYLSMHPNKRV